MVEVSVYVELPDGYSTCPVHIRGEPVRRHLQPSAMPWDLKERGRGVGSRGSPLLAATRMARLV
jgi:hypothetical protein